MHADKFTRIAMVMRDALVEHSLTNLLGNRFGGIGGCAGQQQRKFILAIAGGEVFRASTIGADRLPDRSEHDVRGFLTVGLLKRLIVINLRHHQGQCLRRSQGPVPLLFKPFLECTPIQKAAHWTVVVDALHGARQGP